MSYTSYVAGAKALAVEASNVRIASPDFHRRFGSERYFVLDRTSNVGPVLPCRENL